MTETTISVRVSPHVLRHINGDRGDRGVKVFDDTIQYQIGDETYLKLWNGEVDLNE